jgi:predicted peptidase
MYKVQTPDIAPVEVIRPNADSAYEKHEWISGKDTLRYRLLLPRHFDAAKTYPLVLFLHGSGERGSDNVKQLTHGAQLFLDYQNRVNFPAIVVFPQCSENDYWSNVEIKLNDSTQKREFHFKEGGDPTNAMRLLVSWLPELDKKYLISPDQRYVMGLSMGGMGTYEIVRRMPNYFAAAVPICGGAHPATAKDIRFTAFWIFHGDRDNVVSYTYSEQMADAIVQFFDRADVVYTLYLNITHNSWDKAFAEPDLLFWLFDQRNTKKRQYGH